MNPSRGEGDATDTRSGASEGDRLPSQKKTGQPNPYHTLGDAMQFWHRQLQMIEEEMAQEGAAEEPEPTRSGEQESGGAEAPRLDGGEFEFTRADDAFDTQVLADATQEQYDAVASAMQEQPVREHGATDLVEGATEDAEDNRDSSPPPLAAMPQDSRLPKANDVLQKLHDEGPQQKESRSSESGADKEVEEAAEAYQEVEREATREGMGGHVGEGRAPIENQNALSQPAAGSGAIDDAEAKETPADLASMTAVLEAALANWQSHGAAAGAAEDAWRALESRTASLSQELCEQLRLILEATVAAKLQGDYRTGKRISMRKVIPYIASGFRKDKIWLRRTKPSKRRYQIMLCIDDSESMRETGAGGLACEALALLCQALTTLEAGQLAVCSFAERVELLHPFERTLTAESGAYMLSRFTFQQKYTHMESLIETVISTMRAAREQQVSSSASEELQLVLIVSDGRRSPSWGDPSYWIRIAAQQHILLCFVIIDASARKDSILNLQQVSYPKGKLTISRWIDAFPFPYYLVLRDLVALPQVLSGESARFDPRPMSLSSQAFVRISSTADALRQWFEMLRE